MKRLLFLFLFPILLLAQTSKNGRIQVGPLASGPGLPLPCSPSDQWNTNDGHGAYICITTNTWQQIGGGGTNYQTIQTASATMIQEPILKFPNLSCVDNPGNNSTDCTALYQFVLNNASVLPQEPRLNCVPPLSCTDNGANTRTDLSSPTFVGAGGSHSAGAVPDPGATPHNLPLCDTGTFSATCQLASTGTLVQNPLTSSGLSNTAFPFQINGDVDFGGPNPYIDIRVYGAREITGSAPSAPASCTFNSNQITVGAITGSFVIGDYVNVYGCGATNTVATPSAPTITSGSSEMQTVPDAVIDSMTGSSSYSYLLVTKDANGGLTLPGPAVSTTTGVVLGKQSVATTSVVATGNTLTIGLASAGPANGAMFRLSYVQQGGAQTQHQLDGYYNVCSGGGTTTIVVCNLPFYANQTDNAGSVVIWFNGNAVKWTNQTGAYEQIICGKRPGDSSYKYLGVSIPASGTNPAFTQWTDWGTTLTIPPSVLGISNGNCTSASVINDYLNNVKITNISGSTFTLSGNAGSTVGATTVLQDSAPALLAAMTAAQANTHTALTIPCATASGSYQFNSPIFLNSVGNWVEQCGTISLNETINLNGIVQWIGRVGSEGSSTPVNVYIGAYPAFNNISTFNNITMNFSGNQNLGILAGAQNTIFRMEGNNFNGNDSSSIGVLTEGSQEAGTMSNTTWNMGPANDPTHFDSTWTPVLYIDGFQILNYTRSYGFARGIFANNTGATECCNSLNIDEFYVQGAIMPMLGMYGSSGGVSSGFINATKWTSDTSPQPMISLQLNPANTAHFTVRTKDLAGLVTQTISGAPVAWYNEGDALNNLQFPFLTNVFPDPVNNYGKLALSTTQVSDNFARANGGVGSNWVNKTNTLVISGNQVTGGTNGAWNRGYYIGTAPFHPGGGQFCEVTVNNYNSFYAGCSVLTNASSGYVCQGNSASNLLQITDILGNDIHDVAYTPGAGDQIYFQSDPSGNMSCTAYPANGTPVTNTASNTGALPAAGASSYPGLDVFGTGVLVSNFSGGTLNPIIYPNNENTFNAAQHFTTAQVQTKLNLSPLAAPPNTLANGDLWSTASGVFARISGTTIGLGGSGNVNNASQFFLPYYSGAGSSNQISGATAPSGPASVFEFAGEIPTGSAPTVPVFALAGIPGRSDSSGAPVLVTTDRANRVVFASGSTQAVSISDPTASGFGQNYVVRLKATASGTVPTITPTTATINGAANLVMHRGEVCGLGSADNTTYYADCFDPPITSCVGCTVAYGDNGITLTNTTSAGNMILNSPNTMGASGTLDGSAMATTAGMKTPVGAGAAPTADGAIANNSTNHTFDWGSNGTTMVGAIAATGTGTATTCTNQFVSSVSSLAVPACNTVTPAFAAGNTNGSGNFALTTGAALVTPDIGTATGAQLLLTGRIDGTAPVTISTGTAVTLGGTFKSGYTFNQRANPNQANAIVYTLPTAAAGLQYCVSNSNNGTSPTTGTLEFLTSAAGQFVIFTDGTLSATGGFVISGGAAGDAGCVVGVDATHWQLYVNRGTWTLH